jgi:hypothetical protein
VCATIAAASLVAIHAGAQGMGRHDRGSSSRDTPSRERAKETPPVQGQDPYAALERELPSLGIDLLLNAGQLETWRAFERDVRDLAEMDRARRRHLLSLRQAENKAPGAVSLVSSLVEDERVKAEAASDLKRHLDALYAQLDESQKRTLDRRVVQSQTDPLGR